MPSMFDLVSSRQVGIVQRAVWATVISTPLGAWMLASLLWVATPGAAQAQLLRYELGRRVQSLEAAWELPENEARRSTAVPIVQDAVKNFFSLNLSGAAMKIIEARAALSTDPKYAIQRTLDPLIIEPSARLLDLNEDFKLQVTMRELIPDVVRRGIMIIRLELYDAQGKLVAKAAAPGDADQFVRPITLEPVVKAASMAPGDGKLEIVGVVGEAEYRLPSMTITLVSNWNARLKKLRESLATFDEAKAKPRKISITSESLREHIQVLNSLARGLTLETDFPAHRRLEDAEFLADQLARQVTSPKVSGAGEYWRTFLGGDGAKTVFRMWLPPSSDAPPQPLVIALHGVGGTENMFFDMLGCGKIVRLCQARNWPIVAPRQSLLRGMGLSLKELLDQIEEIYPIDRSRVFLVGHSMGAMQAVKLTDQSLSNGQTLAPALIAALGGGGNSANFAKMNSVQFFVGVGEHDFARRGGIQLVDKLRAAGVKQVKFLDYKDTEHLLIVQNSLPDVFQLCDEIARRRE